MWKFYYKANPWVIDWKINFSQCEQSSYCKYCAAQGAKAPVKFAGCGKGMVISEGVE